MTDIQFCEMANEKCKSTKATLLEYNSTYRLMLCHGHLTDGLFLYQYDDLSMDESEHGWHILRGVQNNNEGFQYIMDLYQMLLTSCYDYKKR